MNHDTKACALPALTADFLRGSEHLIDNLFADLWKTVGMKTLLVRSVAVFTSVQELRSTPSCIT